MRIFMTLTRVHEDSEQRLVSTQRLVTPMYVFEDGLPAEAQRAKLESVMADFMREFDSKGSLEAMTDYIAKEPVQKET